MSFSVTLQPGFRLFCVTAPALLLRSTSPRSLRHLVHRVGRSTTSRPCTPSWSTSDDGPRDQGRSSVYCTQSCARESTRSIGSQYSRLLTTRRVHMARCGEVKRVSSCFLSTLCLSTQSRESRDWF